MEWKYIDNDTLNGQAIAWLERTANAKVYAVTKKYHIRNG
jgi:hypothetical protein